MRVAALSLVLGSVLALGAAAHAAPLRFDPVPPVVSALTIAPLDQDTARLGYVTAFRSPFMGALVEGRARVRPDPSILGASTIGRSLGGWTVTTAVATASVFLPLIGGVPQVRLDASQQPLPSLALILNLHELGVLDGGMAAMRRVIDGQRMGSDTDPIALLTSAP